MFKKVTFTICIKFKLGLLRSKLFMIDFFLQKKLKIFLSLRHLDFSNAFDVNVDFNLEKVVVIGIKLITFLFKKEGYQKRCIFSVVDHKS